MKKNEFTEKAKKGIDEVSTKIDEIKAKLDKASDDIKVNYKDELEHLAERRTAIEKRYHALADVAEDEWEDAKETFQMHMESLRSKIKNIFD